MAVGNCNGPKPARYIYVYTIALHLFVFRPLTSCMLEVVTKCMDGMPCMTFSIAQKSFLPYTEWQRSVALLGVLGSAPNKHV